MMTENPNTAPMSPTMQDAHPNLSPLAGKNLLMIIVLMVNKLIRYKYTEYTP